MGAPFDLGDEYFVEFLQARDRFGLRDYFSLDLLARIPGLYSADALDPTDMPWEPPAFSAIFITHVHYDHTQHLRFVDPNIPVHMGEGARTILESLDTTARAPFLRHGAIRLLTPLKDKLAVVTFPGRDVDRIRTFFEAAKAVGRRFVVNAKTAHLLLTLQKDTHIEVPDVTREDDLLLYDRLLRKIDPWEKDLQARLKGRV